MPLKNVMSWFEDGDIEIGDDALVKQDPRLKVPNTYNPANHGNPQAVRQEKFTGMSLRDEVRLEEVSEEGRTGCAGSLSGVEGHTRVKLIPHPKDMTETL